MKHVNALITVALLLGGGTVQAGLINAGFEGDGNGSTYGWTPNTPNGGTVNVLPTWTSPINPSTGPGPSPYSAYYGKYFLIIGSGFSGGTGAGVWQTVSQSVELLAGESLSGVAAFDWNDLSPNYDGARVRILDVFGNVVSPTNMFNWSGRNFPPPLPATPPPYIDYSNGGWTPWSWTATQKGTYTLEYGVVNTVNNRNSSFGLFDATVVSVPEPASLALFVIGLAGLSRMQRRHRTVSVDR